MLSFYTPTQIIRPSVSCYRPQQLRYFDEILFQQTTATIESLEDAQRKMLQWLKRLPLFERQLMLTYTNKQFLCLLRKMYQSQMDNPSLKFCIEKDDHGVFYYLASLADPSPSLVLLPSVVIKTKYTHCDSLSVAPPMLHHLDQLFKEIDEILKGISYEFTKEDCNKIDRDNLFYYPQEDQGVFKGVDEWVAQTLVRNVSYMYYVGQKQKDIQGVKNKMKLYCRMGKDMSLRNLWGKIKKIPSIVLIEKHQNSIKVKKQLLPSIYQTSEEEANNIDLMLFQCSEKIIHNFLCTMKIQESYEEYNYYRTELMKQFQEKINQFQLRSDMQKNQNKIIKKNKKVPTIKINHPPSITLNITIPKIISQNIPTPKMPSQHYPQKPKIQIHSQHKLQLSLIDNKLQKSLQPQKRHSPQLKPSILPFLQEMKSNDSVFQDIVSDIKRESKRMKPLRQVIFNRIKHTLKQMNLSCQCYGSTACGTAIKDSDIDILIDPSIVNFFYFQFSTYRDKLIKSLYMLKSIFEQQQWLQQFILLPNAAVPLLTMKANPYYYFQCPPNQSNAKLNLQKTKEQISIMVDISIEPYVNMINEMNHLGLSSTQLMKDWLNKYPQLQSLFLLLKTILRKNNLHKAYNGGLNSYTLMVILVAYLNSTIGINSSNRNNNQNKTLFQHYIGAVDFVGRLNQDSVVDVRLQECVMSLKKGSQKMMIINPLNGGNLTQNCYQIQRIQEIFKYSKCMNKNIIIY